MVYFFEGKGDFNSVFICNKNVTLKGELFCNQSITIN